MSTSHFRTSATGKKRSGTHRSNQWHHLQWSCAMASTSVDFQHSSIMRVFVQAVGRRTCCLPMSFVFRCEPMRFFNPPTSVHEALLSSYQLTCENLHNIRSSKFHIWHAIPQTWSRVMVFCLRWKFSAKLLQCCLIVHLQRHRYHTMYPYLSEEFFDAIHLCNHNKKRRRCELCFHSRKGESFLFAS